MADQSQVPNWYRIWRMAAYVGFLAFAAGTLIALPWAILGNSIPSTGFQSALDLGALDQRLAAIMTAFILVLFAVGAVLGVLVVVAGAIHFVYMRYSRNTLRNPAVKTGKLALLVLIGGVVYFVALAMMGPAIGELFGNIQFGTCLVHVKVVVFEDTNGNGVRDTNETGLDHVNLRVLNGNMPTRTGKTDETGFAFIVGQEYSCGGFRTISNNPSAPPERDLPSDMFMLAVQSPDGYGPAGEIKSGPYSARWSTNTPVVYVPLRKGN